MNDDGQFLAPSLLSTDKTNVRQGDLLPYFVRVQNLGPQAAPDVVVNSLLSSGVTFVAAARKTERSTRPSGWVSGGHALSRRGVAPSKCAAERAMVSASI
jgi:uncharacterized repeat protein (TIGR01451 family)